MADYQNTSGSTESSAPMFGPDGQVHLVPNSQVPLARQNQGEPAVPMRDPQGTLRYVRASQVGDAQQAGGRVDFTGMPKAQHDGFWSAFGSDLLGMAKGVAQMNPASQAINAVQHAGQEIQSLRSTGSTLEQQENQRRAAEGYGGLYRNVTAPLAEAVGVNAQGMEQAASQGDTGAVAGHAAAPLAATAAGELVPRVMPKVVEAVPTPRGMLAERMAQTPPGEPFTRAEVANAAQQHGVNLDLAQATESKTLGAVKKANQYSIAGQGAYEANATRNLNALEQWADSEAAKYSPQGASREVLGAQLQDALKRHLETQKGAATQAFQDLDRRVGSVGVDATNTVENEARNIVAANEAYYKQHPELTPTKAWNVVKDLAERPTVKTVNPEATAPGLMDAAGEPIKATGSTVTKPAARNVMSWSDLHQLRSDLMDVYRNSPDIVKGQSEAWLQRMVGKIDEAMTGAAGGMSPADLQKFRQANSIWESIKKTYDNPQSPYYHAVRAQYPSQVPGMLSKATPELARQVRSTLGSLEGPFQRQFVENLITAKDGQTLDLGRLDQKLRGIPQEHLEAMVGTDGARQLRLLGKVSKKVLADANPSGTAKVGVPAAELSGLLHAPGVGAAELAGQYGLARAINSPTVLDYLTKK